MELKKKDEEKRTRYWKLILITSTLAIVLVAGFFLLRSVFGNPLEGTWVSEEAGYRIELDDENEMQIETTVKEAYVEVDAIYVIDKSVKTITIKPELMSYEEAAEDAKGTVTGADIDAKLAELMTTFDYSLDGNTLTLTEREYGEQFIFTRVK